MSEFVDSWGITLAVFLPVVGAAVMLVIPSGKEKAHKYFALAVSLALTVKRIGPSCISTMGS